MQVSKEELKIIFEGGKFAEEDKAIIIDFCNTFQKVFSNVIYADELHELMHIVSMHLPRENPNFGLVQGLKTGSVDMNEIMTEYFTTRLLLQEGIEDLI